MKDWPKRTLLDEEVYIHANSIESRTYGPTVHNFAARHYNMWCKNSEGGRNHIDCTLHQFYKVAIL